MDAVLETYEATDFTLWPVADPPPGPLLTLSGRLSPREVGTVMAVLTSYNKGGHGRPDRDPEGGVEQLRRLVEAESVIAPGGLRIQDTVTDVTASPGCCFGLENWRDWLELMTGEEPWLGHDPAPRIEHAGSLVRLWPDSDDPAGLPMEIPLSDLPVTLGSVRNDLRDFLTLVERWAADHAPTLAPALVAKLDESLAIGAPLRQAEG
ncbi:hypothetical protein AB0P15_30810 [Streptomyces sp. NPDC087917]|uniref:hypothetical protein n=1 Tax=Streptomyces sp. NPDC087917 TaxID=3155060 RepID=UPI00342635CC